VPGVEVRVLFYNTFLLRALRLPGGRWLHQKPEVPARVREIGAALQDAYDVAALAEVFVPEDREVLVAAAGTGAPSALAVAIGPDAHPPAALTSSGLVTLSRRPLVRQATHELRERGRRRSDSDAWAAKGVLLAEVDLGQPGNLEVYSTHLFYGGDLWRSAARHRSPALHRIRQAQVEELLAFVDATHRPGNVALVVGDLNIDAEGNGPDGQDPERGLAAAEDLREAMDVAGFDDVWSVAGNGPGWTCDLLVAPAERFPADPDDPELCLEPAPPAQPGDHLVRIDHAYLQRPTPSHAVEVAVRKVRRRTFPRPVDAPGRVAMPTMSDHLGLHLDLEARPR